MDRLGLLWFDSSTRPLKDKIQATVTQYKRKFKRVATHCYVHPSEVEGQVIIAGVVVEPDPTTVCYHYRVVGLSDEEMDRIDGEAEDGCPETAID